MMKMDRFDPYYFKHFTKCRNIEEARCILNLISDSEIFDLKDFAIDRYKEFIVVYYNRPTLFRMDKYKFDTYEFERIRCYVYNKFRRKK